MTPLDEEEKTKGSLVINMKNLATAEDKLTQLNITHDMTKKERLPNREKLAEAKNKIFNLLQFWRLKLTRNTMPDTHQK